MTLNPFFRRILPLLVLLALIAPAAGAANGPVTFIFRLPSDPRNPFARDLWAEVVTPSGRALHLPVFFYGDGEFAVRARADEKGGYRLGPITEHDGGKTITLSPALKTRGVILISSPERLPAVRISARHPREFQLADGTPFYPVGSNLAWAPQGRMEFYRQALAQFGRAGLDWARVWMVHWSGLNLDWLPPDMGKSPPPGILDMQVARDWDELVSLAEQNGVYLQMVLQHHGQYSSTTNPNWPDNPWNVANGGFLKNPAGFFTSPIAQGLTALKYRYIVARWGYSPAIMAWELFNEVQWTDALKLDHNEAAVATWHDEMAAYIRSIDPYHHLITTSYSDLRSPIFASMDYDQPHLYDPNMLDAVRHFDVPPSALPKPVFYGEASEGFTDAEIKAGSMLTAVPWASLMSGSAGAAQPWSWEHVLASPRALRSLGALAKFAARYEIARRPPELTGFEPVVMSDATVPTVFTAGYTWAKRPVADIIVPADGREPANAADIPSYLVGDAVNLAAGYAGRVAFTAHFPAAVTARLALAGVGDKGASLRVTLDGRIVLEKTWPALPAPSRDPAGHGGRPADFSFPVPAGEHRIVIANPTGPDALHFGSLDLGFSRPALAAAGRRAADFVMIWVWNRGGFAVADPAPVQGRVVVPALPAGAWTLTWWNPTTGQAGDSQSIDHRGGDLTLATPAIAQGAVAVLERQP